MSGVIWSCIDRNAADNSGFIKAEGIWSSGMIGTKGICRVGGPGDFGGAAVENRGVIEGSLVKAFVTASGTAASVTGVGKYVLSLI